MKMFKSLALVFVLFMGMANVAFAQADDHVVTIEVQAINEILIAGDVTLTISSATPGSDPAPATDATSYAITTNDAGGTTKITASTDQNVGSLGDGPANDLVLSVTATAPTGGTSAGATSLSTVAADVVTGMAPVSEAGVALSYSLTATAETGQVASTAITVTYTIVN